MKLKYKVKKTGSKEDVKLQKLQGNITTKLNKSPQKGYFKVKLLRGEYVKDFRNYL